MATTRPPPKILFVHNSAPDPRHILHLTDASLHVEDVHIDVNDGAGAVAKAIAFQPDVIVLDYSADGEVTRALRRHESTKDIPIIALAALAQNLLDPT